MAIKQWGHNSCANGTTIIAYPISFTVEPSKLISSDGNFDTGVYFTINSGDPSFFQVLMSGFGGGGAAWINWFAIGY